MLGEKKNITLQYNKTKVYLNKDFCVSAILFVFSKQHSIENSYSWGSNSKEFLLLTSQVPIFYFMAKNKVTKSPNQLASEITYCDVWKIARKTISFLKLFV